MLRENNFINNLPLMEAVSINVQLKSDASSKDYFEMKVVVAKK